MLIPSFVLWSFFCSTHIDIPVYIEDSFVHGSLEFKVIKSDFPMKFGNPGTNLIKFILEPSSMCRFPDVELVDKWWIITPPLSVQESSFSCRKS